MPLANIYSRRHPICHHEWSTVVPADCENGDNIGKVSYLYTHAEFFSFYWRYATPLEHEDYSYEIVGGNGDGAFAIDAEGELTVANASNFTETRDITVRVKVFDWYFNDCTCTIRRIPVEDCIYFDFSVSAGAGDGTRSNPYKSFADRVSILGNGEAGKSYFWRRGQTFTQEWSKLWQPDINGEHINYAGWGQGPCYKIDLSSNLTSQRFVDIGTSLSGTWEQNTCHNFRMYDAEFTHDMSSTVFPIQGNPYGKNWEIHRIKAENCTFSNGFLWFIGVFSVGYIEKNLKISDIQTSISTSRQVKFECGDVEGWNFKCYNDNSSNGALISATTHPFVSLKYVHYTHENEDENSLGMNLRARGHSVEYAVFDVKGYPMVLFNLGSSEGQGADYNIDDSCYFKNIIVKRCEANALNICINQTANNEINGARFENIISFTGKPFWVHETAKNLKFRNILMQGSGTFGIRVWASAGDNGSPVIENCTILGFTNSVQADSGKNATIRNSIITNLSGDVTDENNTTVTTDFQDPANNNYRISVTSPLNWSVPNIGNDFDIVGIEWPTSGGTTPGAHEYSTEPLEGPEDLSTPTPPEESLKVIAVPGMELAANKIFRTVQANPANYEQGNYELYGELRVEKISGSNTYERTLTSRLSPNVDDRVTFELQDGIADFFPLPTLDPFAISSVALTNDNQIRAQFYAAESYGDPATVQNLVLVSTFRVLNGGIPKVFDIDFFNSFLPGTKRFLTWHPGTKRIDPQQPELLHFFAYEGITEIKLMIKVYFTDQTDDTITRSTTTGILQNRIYRIPAGFMSLNINAVDPEKQVVKYDLWLEDQNSDVIANPMTYVIEQVPRSTARYWMYTNSLGMWEIMRTEGKTSNVVNIEKETSTGYLQQGYSRTRGEIRSRVMGSTKGKEVSTGFFDSRAEQEWAQEILYSDKVFLLDQGLRIPYIINDGEFPLDEDQDYKWFLRFNALQAYNDVKYGKPI